MRPLIFAFSGKFGVFQNFLYNFCKKRYNYLVKEVPLCLITPTKN